MSNFTCSNGVLQLQDGPMLVEDYLDSITDRTLADVYYRTPKGYYSHTDLNRVEKNTSTAWIDLRQALNEVLPLLSKYQIEGVWSLCPQIDIQTLIRVKPYWNALDIPRQAEMTRYLRNIHKVITALREVDLPQTTDTMNYLTWEQANAIEQAIQQIVNNIAYYIEIFKSRISRVAASQIYSSEIYGGEI